MRWPLSLIVLICALSPGLQGSYSVRAMAVDPSGNIWLTGLDSSGSVPVTADAVQPKPVDSTCGFYKPAPGIPLAPIPCDDAFLIKLDPSGITVLYATYLGGQGDDGGLAIAAGADGDIYIVGYSDSADFPVSPGAFQVNNAGPRVKTVYNTTLPGGDIFAARFDRNGSLKYSTLLGGSDNDLPMGIRVDAAGSAYVAGTTLSPDFPVTPAGLRTTIASGGGFITKLNPSGAALAYSTFFDASIGAFEIDPSGALYVTGTADDSLPVTSGAAQTSFGGGSDDGFVAKVDPFGASLMYSTWLGGSDQDAGSAITLDSSGAVWVAVSTSSSDFPKSGNNPGAYLLRLAPNGSAITTALGFGANSKTRSSGFRFLAVDGRDNVYGLGFISPENVRPTANAALPYPCLVAGGDFIAETNAAGELLYASWTRQSIANLALTASGRFLLYSGGVPPVISAFDPGATTALNFTCPVNSASFSTGTGIAPGEIVSLFGYGIGPPAGMIGRPDASGHMPSTLAGVQVLFNGIPAPLLYVQTGQINAVVPIELPLAGNARVELRYNGQTAPPLELPLQATDPGVFTIRGSAGAILNQNGTLNSASNPAKLGSIVTLFTTGIGLPDTAGVTDGEIVPVFPPFLPLNFPPSVSFAGVAGTTIWAGAAPALVFGVMQINALLPSLLPDGVPLEAVPVIVGMYPSSAPVTVSVVP